MICSFSPLVSTLNLAFIWKLSLWGCRLSLTVLSKHGRLRVCLWGEACPCPGPHLRRSRFLRYWTFYYCYWMLTLIWSSFFSELSKNRPLKSWKWCHLLVTVTYFNFTFCLYQQSQRKSIQYNNIFKIFLQSTGPLG